MLGYHRILIRSNKFYLRIFFHFLDMLCCNSWILWRRALTDNNSDDYLPLAQFKLGLAEILTRSHVTSKKRGRPNSSLQPQLDLKKGNNILLRKYQPKKFVATMWDIFLSGMKIAKFPECKGKTQVWCDKCNVRLCLNKDRIEKDEEVALAFILNLCIRPPSKSFDDFANVWDSVLPLCVYHYDNVLTLGDINSDLSNADNSLNKSFSCYGFCQIVKEPTRITETSATLIGAVFSNTKEVFTITMVLDAGEISDHRLVCCSLDIAVKKTKQIFITFGDFKNFDENGLCDDLSSIVDFLTRNILNVFDIHGPLTTNIGIACILILWTDAGPGTSGKQVRQLPQGMTPPLRDDLSSDLQVAGISATATLKSPVDLAAL
ncbi:unnamed protein product [Acanthoscelides obtectus]|uniref:Uncharacterized protein n=1 Tax=Acanthoscelides obtectus TaxID=200917 RepID=A0A9P0P4J4_ACAOB|nr:unnamed protein product [Acanthoscelides obtectus]CAK1671961.1 hypothetical protein AOBTE_LOCUS28568 [Acanthoscelides obtectus]